MLQKTAPPHLYVPKIVILLSEVTSVTQNIMPVNGRARSQIVDLKKKSAFPVTRRWAPINHLLTSNIVSGARQEWESNCPCEQHNTESLVLQYGHGGGGHSTTKLHIQPPPPRVEVFSMGALYLPDPLLGIMGYLTLQAATCL